MKKYILKYWIVISVLAVVIVTEATLRLALGQGSPVLSQADSDTGYRFQPNQKIYRFGKNTDEPIKNYFIDRIHLTVKGNQATTNLLFEKLCVEQELSACSTTKP